MEDRIHNPRKTEINNKAISQSAQDINERSITSFAVPQVIKNPRLNRLKTPYYKYIMTVPKNLANNK